MRVRGIDTPTDKMEFSKKATADEFRRVAYPYLQLHSPNLQLYFVFIDTVNKTFLHMYGTIRDAKLVATLRSVSYTHVVITNMSGKELHETKLKHLRENDYSDAALAVTE